MKNKSRTPQKPPYTPSCPSSPCYQQQILQKLQANSQFKQKNVQNRIALYSKQMQVVQNSKQERVRVNVNIIRNNIIKSVYQLLKREDFCRLFDIVVKVLVKENQGSVSQVDGKIRACQAVVFKYELLLNLSKYPIQNIIECNVIGVKAKNITLQEFLSSDRNTERNINLPLKQGQIHRNNTMEHRKKWAIAKYGTGNIDKKRKASKNSDISGSSKEQIEKKSSQAKLQARREKKPQQKQRKSVEINKNKRQLQLISGSQDSQQPAPIKQLTKKKEDGNIRKQENLQQNKKISKGEKVQEQKINEIIQKKQVKVKQKSKKNSKSKSKSKSQNKSKGGNKRNSKNKEAEVDRKQLIAIQEANLNEEISNRKNKQIQQRQLRESQEKLKNKSEDIIHRPFSFMNKKMSLQSQDNAQKQQQVNQQQLNQELSSPHQAILSNLQPQQQKQIGQKVEEAVKNAEDSELSYEGKKMEQNSQHIKSRQEILKKILKQPIQQKTSHKNDGKDEAEQDRILQSLSISYDDSSHHHRSQGIFANNSQVHRQLSNNSQVQGSTEAKSNQIRRGNTVESKKKKKNAMPSNNMTLDQFFKKKQK